MGPDSAERLSIQTFLATPERVELGDKVTLLWSVEGAETVSIDNGVGEVAARGSRQVTLSATTTYTLTAASGSSSATASVRVLVGGTSNGPSPSPAPSPSPTPPIVLGQCGQQAPAPDSCSLVVTHATLPPAFCVQLTRLTVSPSCPVADGTTRTIGFDITARAVGALTWRRAAGGADAVSPGSGTVSAEGMTTVNTTARVYDSALTFEVLDGSGRALLSFTLKHRP